MTFEQIKTFLVVARAGNFTRAAQELYLSQPAVSQQILALEKQLESKLFERNGRSLLLTPAGQRFATYAQALLQDTDAMLADLQTLDDPLQGVVSIGAINSAGVYVLPNAIASFQHRYPSVRIELKIGNTEQITDVLQQGALDLAIVDMVVSPSSARNLRREEFHYEDGALIVPPGHAWAHRKDVAVHELSAQRILMRERGARSRTVLEAELTRLGVELTQLQVGMELGSTEAIKQAVASALGIGFVPACAIVRELQWKVLARATFKEGEFGRQLWLYSPSRRGIAKRIQLFRDFLLNES